MTHNKGGMTHLGSDCSLSCLLSKAEDDNSKLTLERLDALGRVSLLQTLQGLLDAQNKDSKTGRTNLPYLHGRTPGSGSMLRNVHSMQAADRGLWEKPVSSHQGLATLC